MIISYEVTELLDKTNEKNLQLVGKVVDNSRKVNLITQLNVITSFNQMKELFLNKDREGLYNFLKDAFNNLKAKYGISGIHIILPDHTTLLRVNKPTKYGDIITDKKRMIYRANATRKPLSGVEKGKYYYGFRYIKPIFYHQNYLGVIEISIFFTKDWIRIWLADLKKQLGNRFNFAYFPVKDGKIVSKDSVNTFDKKGEVAGIDYLEQALKTKHSLYGK